MNHKVVCTAGHIDHGKTALIKALTGMDTDRLQEEKIRGITIDLGFGFYDDDTTIIDLPGHERFIRNMVAGAATVDFAILVVAADDGPMPQTQEHLDILSLLGISRGIIAISKADLVDDEWLELVVEEVREKVADTFLREEPILIVDSLSGRGIDQFRSAFNDALKNLPPRKTRSEYRQPVDRSFTIKGFGTVITGTVVSGKVSLKDTVELMPGRKRVKIRGIQVHGKDCSSASAGTRAALNLSGVEKWEISRGDTLAKPGFLSPADRLDCQVKLLKSSQPLKHRQRLRFHLGTAEIIGRILLLEDNLLEPGGTAFAQLELENPALALRGDRFVFRTYSPQVTIGGGTVLISAKEKHKRRQKPLHDLLSALASGDKKSIVTRLLSNAGSAGTSAGELLSQSGIPGDEFTSMMEEFCASGEIITEKSGGESWYTLTVNLKEIYQSIRTAVGEFHRQYPAKPGMSLAQLKGSLNLNEESPFIESAAEDMVKSGELKRSDSLYSLIGHKISLNERQEKISHEMLNLIRKAGISTLRAHPIAEELEVEVEEIKDLMPILESLGEVVRLDRDTVISREAFEDSLEKLRKLEASEGIIRLQDAVKALGSARRMTVTLLEHLDSAGITVRFGDERKFKLGIG